MPRSGTGSYTLPAPSPFQNGQTADATGMMTVLSDIATAMTASTANDGQTKITGNWNFNSNSISGVTTLSTAALTVTTSGATITGNSTVTGTLAISGVTTAANGTTGTQVVNYSQFPATLASPGTITLPTGLIIKWGTGTTTLGFGSVGFATSFPTNVLNIQITPSGATGVLTIRPLALGAATGAGFQVWGDAAESFGFNWVALGY
jgi:hypothetical protein